MKVMDELLNTEGPYKDFAAMSAKLRAAASAMTLRLSDVRTRTTPCNAHFHDLRHSRLRCWRKPNAHSPDAAITNHQTLAMAQQYSNADVE